jgi:hypothetical protein
MSQSPFFATACGVEPEFVSSDKVRQLLGYTNRSSFFQAVRQAGIPYVRINARRIIFPVAGVRAWLASRTVGSMPANYSVIQQQIPAVINDATSNRPAAA